MLQEKAHHISKVDETKETIESLLKGPDRAIWKHSIGNEWGVASSGE